ncbi:MAG: hypothetical protein ACKVQR_04865 [Aquabacterium sp.]
MVEPAPAAPPEADPVSVYKGILQEVLDRRPSGTRQKLALALKRNRSFVTQIVNPSYAVPIPARHVATIFEVCHFAQTERVLFLEAYHRAHPRSLVTVSSKFRARHVHFVLPELGSAEKNKALEDLVERFIAGVVKFAARGDDQQEN